MKLPSKSVSSRQLKVISVFVIWGVIICFRAVYDLCVVSMPPGGSDMRYMSTSGSWDEQCAEVQLFRSWQLGITQPSKEVFAVGDGDLESKLKEDIQHPNETFHKKVGQNTSVELNVLHELSLTNNIAGKDLPASSMQRTTKVPANAATHHVHAVASTAWGQGLLDLQENLDRQIKQQHLVRAERLNAHQHQAWDKAFSAEIASYERELCEDPSREEYSICISLRNHGKEASNNNVVEESYNRRRAKSDAWTTGLQDLQKRLEERRHALHQKHHSHSWLSSGHVKGMADWAADLETMHTQLTDPSPSSSSSSSSISSNRSMAAAHSPFHATTWSVELEALHQRIEARRLKQRRRIEEHDILPGDLEDDGQSLLNRIAGLNKQLCESSERRRNLPSCAKFRAEVAVAAASSGKIVAALGQRSKFHQTSMGDHSVHIPASIAASRLRGSGLVSKELHEYEEQLRHLQDSHRHWEEAFSAKVASQMREMCADLRHRSHGHCRDFLEHDIHAADHLALHWPPKASKDTLPVVVVSASVLVSARWSGRIPSVGCVTLVPQSLHVERWMDSFVDNFRHQQFEGSKSLVLVYHHGDHRASRLAKQHADGLFIKAVAAQDGEFPSTAAARFGMWHVRDADIVARWDFEAWHHPERLNMQVRALALAGRPAGLLARWTSLNSTGGRNTVESGSQWDGSLAGEGSWMQKNWYPFLREGMEGVVGPHAHQDVVSVDEPGLLVYDSLSP